MNKSSSEKNKEIEAKTNGLKADSTQADQLENNLLSKNNELPVKSLKIDVENTAASSKEEDDTEGLSKDHQANTSSKIVDENTSNKLKSNSSLNHQELLENGRILRPRSKGLLKTPWKSVLRSTLKPVKRFPSELQAEAVEPPANAEPTTNQQPPEPTTTQQPETTTTQQSEAESTTEATSTQQPESSKPQQDDKQDDGTNKKRNGQKVWSDDEKEFFYKALTTYGKDFEAITKAMEVRMKRRGDEASVKTKEQIRHLYYRTWAVVNKLLSGHGMIYNKSQELSAVINYGRLRCKFDGVTFKKKGVEKLKELINSGSTSIRMNGKNLRLKRSASKALKKITNQEQIKSLTSAVESRSAKLPLRITLELLPLNMLAWKRVVSVAHNPRIKFDIPTDLSVAMVTSYLQLKWRFISEKMYAIADEVRMKKKFPASTTTPKHHLHLYIPPESVIRRQIHMQRLLKTCNHFLIIYTNPLKSRVVTSSEAVDNVTSSQPACKKSKVDDDVTEAASTSSTAAVTSSMSKKSKVDDDVTETASTSSATVVTSSQPTCKISKVNDDVTEAASTSSAAAVTSSMTKKPKTDDDVTETASTSSAMGVTSSTLKRKPAKTKAGKLHQIDDAKTLAELFVILGKPQTLKLCYGWSESEKPSSGQVPSTSSHSLPLVALFDVALSMRAEIQKKIETKKGKKEVVKMKSNKSTQTNKIPSSKKTSGQRSDKQRGVAKLISAKTEDGFTIPNLPPMRRRYQNPNINLSALKPDNSVRIAFNRRIDLFQRCNNHPSNLVKPLPLSKSITSTLHLQKSSKIPSKDLSKDQQNDLLQNSNLISFCNPATESIQSSEEDPTKDPCSKDPSSIDPSSKDPSSIDKILNKDSLTIISDFLKEQNPLENKDPVVDEPTSKEQDHLPVEEFPSDENILEDLLSDDHLLIDNDDEQIKDLIMDQPGPSTSKSPSTSDNSTETTENYEYLHLIEDIDSLDFYPVTTLDTINSSPLRTNEDSQDSLIFALSQCHNRFKSSEASNDVPIRSSKSEDEKLFSSSSEPHQLDDESLQLLKHFRHLIDETNQIR